MSGGGVGAQGQLTRGSNGLSPGTKYKRSKNVITVTPITLSLGRLGTHLLGLATQSLIGSSGNLVVGANFRARRFTLREEILSFQKDHCWSWTEIVAPEGKKKVSNVQISIFLPKSVYSLNLCACSALFHKWTRKDITAINFLPW